MSSFRRNPGCRSSEGSWKIQALSDLVGAEHPASGA